jgi:hypothetical protein
MVEFYFDTGRTYKDFIVLDPAIYNSVICYVG